MNADTRLYAVTQICNHYDDLKALQKVTHTNTVKHCKQVDVNLKTSPARPTKERIQRVNEYHAPFVPSTLADAQWML